MPSCRAIFRTRRSGSVPLVATRRIRSDTSAVGLSSRGLRGTADKADVGCSYGLLSLSSGASAV